MTVDYVVVGSGLSGAVAARVLKDKGHSVLVVERRDHLGGNVHDHIVHGVRVHTYGPHYFRTNSEAIWKFVTRFAKFHRFEACLKSMVDGKAENWPIAGSYLRAHCGDDWKSKLLQIDRPTNFEQACLAMMPQLIYEKFVKGYTEKQWGVPCTELTASLAGRFAVHEDDDPRLKFHKYQGIPLCGYAKFMERMLGGLDIICGVDFLSCKEEFPYREGLIYTGPLDAWFNYDEGPLEYRSQQRTTLVRSTAGTLAAPQVNYPSVDVGKIRDLDWKLMMPESHRPHGVSVVTSEVPYTPTDPNDFEYPFPSRDNNARAEIYRSRTKWLRNIHVCGRLGSYRYLDMDQSIGAALSLAENL